LLLYGIYVVLMITPRWLLFHGGIVVVVVVFVVTTHTHHTPLLLLIVICWLPITHWLLLHDCSRCWFVVVVVAIGGVTLLLLYVVVTLLLLLVLFELLLLYVTLFTLRWIPIYHVCYYVDCSRLIALPRVAVGSRCWFTDLFCVYGCCWCCCCWWFTVPLRWFVVDTVVCYVVTTLLLLLITLRRFDLLLIVYLHWLRFDYRWRLVWFCWCCWLLTIVVVGDCCWCCWWYRWSPLLFVVCLVTFTLICWFPDLRLRWCRFGLGCHISVLLILPRSHTRWVTTHHTDLVTFTFDLRLRCVDGWCYRYVVVVALHTFDSTFALLRVPRWCTLITFGVPDCCYVVTLRYRCCSLLLRWFYNYLRCYVTLLLLLLTHVLYVHTTLYVALRFYWFTVWFGYILLHTFTLRCRLPVTRFTITLVDLAFTRCWWFVTLLLVLLLLRCYGDCCYVVVVVTLLLFVTFVRLPFTRICCYVVTRCYGEGVDALLLRLLVTFTRCCCWIYRLEFICWCCWWYGGVSPFVVVVVKHCWLLVLLEWLLWRYCWFIHYCWFVNLLRYCTRFICWLFAICWICWFTLRWCCCGDCTALLTVAIWCYVTTFCPTRFVVVTLLRCWVRWLIYRLRYPTLRYDYGALPFTLRWWCYIWFYVLLLFVATRLRSLRLILPLVILLLIWLRWFVTVGWVITVGTTLPGTLPRCLHTLLNVTILRWFTLHGVDYVALVVLLCCSHVVTLVLHVVRFVTLHSCCYTFCHTLLRWLLVICCWLLVMVLLLFDTVIVDVVTVFTGITVGIDDCWCCCCCWCYWWYCWYNTHSVTLLGYRVRTRYHRIVVDYVVVELPTLFGGLFAFGVVTLRWLRCCCCCSLRCWYILFTRYLFPFVVGVVTIYGDYGDCVCWCWLQCLRCSLLRCDYPFILMMQLGVVTLVFGDFGDCSCYVRWLRYTLRLRLHTFTLPFTPIYSYVDLLLRYVLRSVTLRDSRFLHVRWWLPRCYVVDYIWCCWCCCYDYGDLRFTFCYISPPVGVDRCSLRYVTVYILIWWLRCSTIVRCWLQITLLLLLLLLMDIDWQLVLRCHLVRPTVTTTLTVTLLLHYTTLRLLIYTRTVFCGHGCRLRTFHTRWVTPVPPFDLSAVWCHVLCLPTHTLYTITRLWAVVVTRFRYCTLFSWFHMHGFSCLLHLPRHHTTPPHITVTRITPTPQLLHPPVATAHVPQCHYLRLVTDYRSW